MTKILQTFLCFVATVIPLLAANSGESLEPVEGYFSSFDFEHSYHNGVRSILLKGLPDNGCATMVTLPSFAPESAVSLVESRGSFTVISRTLSQSIWASKDSGKISITERKHAIDTKVARAIAGVFAHATNQARYPKTPQSGLDGTSFYFSSFVLGTGNRTGKTWSPDSGSICGRLTALGAMLAKFAETNDADVKKAEEQLYSTAKKLDEDLER